MGTALHEKCDCCGRRENLDKGVFIHTFGGYAGYGSVHDEDYVMLHFCSECLDRMLAGRPPKSDDS